MTSLPNRHKLPHVCYKFSWSRTRVFKNSVMPNLLWNIKSVFRISDARQTSFSDLCGFLATDDRAFGQAWCRITLRCQSCRSSPPFQTQKPKPDRQKLVKRKIVWPFETSRQSNFPPPPLFSPFLSLCSAGADWQTCRHTHGRTKNTSEQDKYFIRSSLHNSISEVKTPSAKRHQTGKFCPRWGWGARTQELFSMASSIPRSSLKFTDKSGKDFFWSWEALALLSSPGEKDMHSNGFKM